MYEFDILEGDVHDIDIVLFDKKIWKNFSETYKVISVPFGKAVRIDIPFYNIEIEFLDCIGPDKFNYMAREGIVSNGIHFITLENLITWKELLNRPKDHIHIELIKKYLQNLRKRGTKISY